MIKKSVFFLILTLSCHQAIAANLYRYTDEHGKKVITTNLPARIAPLGYDILSSNGRLIKRIPAQKSAAQVQKEQQASHQIVSDQQLLRDYGTMNDFDARFNRKSTEYNNRLGILKNELLENEKQIRYTEDQAGIDERKKGKVSSKTANQLKILTKSQLRINTDIKNLISNWEVYMEQVEKDRQRLCTLLKQCT